MSDYSYFEKKKSFTLVCVVSDYKGKNLDTLDSLRSLGDSFSVKSETFKKEKPQFSTIILIKLEKPQFSTIPLIKEPDLIV